ncbi:MAG: succinylglutamate desuccinylase/aspartoacylase family protein [Gammaproteobacteria bacterium]|nr:succinylglutamate desuccinylase/aspartoacylase family protein [Gammaproteobacteria bacterium]
MLKLSKRLIDITGMRDIIQRRIPVLTLDSKKPGPVVWLIGCIHGDEPGGVAIIHDVFKLMRETDMACGTLNALPLVNSMGFENVSRFINSDREDLNRCFPGDAKGTMGERIARRLFDLIIKTEPDLVIDLHNDWIQSVPYLLLEQRSRFRDRDVRKRTIELAAGTGLLIVQESAPDDDAAGALSGAMVAAGVPSFTVEAGGAGGIVEASIASGKRAVVGALHRLGMTGPGAEQFVPAARKPRVLDYTSHPRCTSSGIIRFAVTPGQQIEAEQKLAEVYSAFGSIEETLRADASGYVLGVSDHARVVPGTEIVAIAERAAANQN